MRRVVLGVLVLTALAAAGAVGLVGWLDRRAGEPFRGYAGDECLVTIESGTRVAAIGRRLIEAGVVQDLRVFRWAVWRSGAERRLQAGEYRFDRPMSVLEVVDKLARGDVVRWPVTFPEGLTIRAMSDLFAQAGLGAGSDFIDAARASDLVSDLDPQAPDLEGYLFPDTYALPRGTSARRLVSLMVSSFRDATGPGWREDAHRLGLTVRQAVTLASLVEKETARPEERALVAAVYHNRLRRGMLLQCDPTVIYALEQTAPFSGNLQKRDLDLDSRYNTYRHPGLPPGPIAAPGRASLEAAVRPAKVDYLYFVSRNDGTHVFASTLAEHNANVRKYQLQYFRDRRVRTAPAAPGPGRGRD